MIAVADAKNCCLVEMNVDLTLASLTDETIKSTSLWKSSRHSAGIHLRNVLFKTEKQKAKLKIEKKPFTRLHSSCP